MFIAGIELFFGFVAGAVLLALGIWAVVRAWRFVRALPHRRVLHFLQMVGFLIAFGLVLTRRDPFVTIGSGIIVVGVFYRVITRFFDREAAQKS